jgi:hypothetical protein
MLLEWTELEQRRSERCPSTDRPPIFQTETKFGFSFENYKSSFLKQEQYKLIFFPIH